MWYKCTSKIKLIDQVIPVHKRSCWIRSLDTARLILTCPVLAAFLCEDITKWFNGKGGAAIFFVWVQNKKKPCLSQLPNIIPPLFERRYCKHNVQRHFWLWKDWKRGWNLRNNISYSIFSCSTYNTARKKYRCLDKRYPTNLKFCRCNHLHSIAYS